jgi:hypothetical protein
METVLNMDLHKKQEKERHEARRRLTVTEFYSQVLVYV